MKEHNFILEKFGAAYYKIGKSGYTKSGNPANRQKIIRSGNPRTIEVIHVIPNNSGISDKEFQGALQVFHQKNKDASTEWYLIPHSEFERVLNLVNNYCNNLYCSEYITFSTPEDENNYKNILNTYDIKIKKLEEENKRLKKSIEDEKQTSTTVLIELVQEINQKDKIIKDLKFEIAYKESSI